MNNEIAILIVGTGESSQQFQVGLPMYLNYETRNKKRRFIAKIKDEVRYMKDDGCLLYSYCVYVGYDKNERLLFEVPVDNCVVIYKAALEVVDE